MKLVKYCDSFEEGRSAFTTYINTVSKYEMDVGTSIG